MLDLDLVRSHFPALADGFVYLDNAGGSQVLRGVADRARDYLLSSNVQVGASYAVSQTSTERVRAAIAATARFVGASSPREIVLGPSTTQLVSNLARAMEGSLSPGDEIVVTTADHEANAGPWKRLRARGVVVKTWRLDPDTLKLEPRGLAPLLTPRTRLVAFCHVSNLLGSLHDVAAITRLAHEHGAKVCVDGVAYAPHRAIDVAAWGVDYYVFSFYKVFGPHQAALFGREEHLAQLDNLNHDFLAHEVPYKLQPGNVNFELSHALGGIYEYFDELGGVAAAFDDIAAHEARLAARLLEGLSSCPRVRVHGDPGADPARRVPTVSFTVEGRTPDEVVRAVDPHGIGIRHGDFYARSLVEELGLAGSGGVVRVSMVHYNTEAEVDRLLAALLPIV